LQSCEAARVDEAGVFAKSLQPASAGLFIPSPARRDEPVEAALEIDPPNIPPEEVQRQLQRLAGTSGVGASGQIQAAPVMVANLVTDRSPRECEIQAIDPTDQAIDFKGHVKWRWTLTPRVTGDVHVTVTLTTPLTVHGHETSYEVTSFKKTVTVTVTGRERVTDILAWAKDNWAILTTLSSGLLTLAGVA
jgi:hypothetical protein